MKNNIFLAPFIAAVAMVPAYAAAPASLESCIVEVCMLDGQAATVEVNESPTDWKAANYSSMYLHFPRGCSNRFSYQLSESTPDSPWPPVVVTYQPAKSLITITGNDMHVRVVLSFHSATKGTASIEWHDEGGSWYVRHADFAVTPSTSPAGLVTMPQAEETDGAMQSVDDGLGELVRELENRKYKTAVERLYQKRLLTVLPQIMEGSDINNVLSNANGTTALHNACGLSHVEIVRWLVEHGADLDAKTAKGASVDDCVGGPNAKAIRNILNKARRER